MKQRDIGNLINPPINFCMILVDKVHHMVHIGGGVSDNIR